MEYRGIRHNGHGIHFQMVGTSVFQREGQGDLTGIFIAHLKEFLRGIMGDRSAEMYLRILLQVVKNHFTQIMLSNFCEEPDFGPEGVAECQPVVLERKTVLRDENVDTIPRNHNNFRSAKAGHANVSCIIHPEKTFILEYRFLILVVEIRPLCLIPQYF